ncbi:unnamed protein product [Allacma fusca]|uniref:Uncharacterized protein n=1 Tax=Allacma fusca TaxID=39272 RepID=A0A8J2NYS3_9HEXA|nr:unnamed protein product [Allacma fusca]
MLSNKILYWRPELSMKNSEVSISKVKGVKDEETSGQVENDGSGGLDNILLVLNLFGNCPLTTERLPVKRFAFKWRSYLTLFCGISALFEILVSICYLSDSAFEIQIIPYR